MNEWAKYNGHQFSLNFLFLLTIFAGFFRFLKHGAVAKWLRQRIANPPSPVRIRAAPLIYQQLTTRILTFSVEWHHFLTVCLPSSCSRYLCVSSDVVRGNEELCLCRVIRVDGDEQVGRQVIRK